MSLLVLDSSVLIAGMLTESLTPQARTLVTAISREQHSIHAPSLLHFEIVSVLRRAVYAGRVSPGQGRFIRNQLLRTPVTLHYDLDLVERAYDIAETLHLPRAYDTQYLALAEQLDCAFWTGDERLFNSVKAGFPLIRWLGQIEV